MSDVTRINPEVAPPWAKKVAKKYDYPGVFAEDIPQDFSDVLGCGHYGCVFALPNTAKVLKLTTDPTEVAFIKAAMALNDWPEGIVEYYSVHDAETLHRKRPIYMIWREAAVEVGLPHLYRPKEYEERALADFNLNLQRFKEHAARARDSINKKKGEAQKRFLEEVAARRDWAWGMVGFDDAQGSRQYGGAWEFSLMDRSRGVDRAALSLQACHVIAETMEHTYLSDLVGGALGFYLDKDILLADVHHNNVGRVEREDFDKPPWVITDPGHAVFLDPERY